MTDTIIINNDIVTVVEIDSGSIELIEVAKQGVAGIQGEQGVAGNDGAAGQGVPVAGLGGQVLTKVDGTDFNTDWITPASGVTDHLLLSNIGTNTHTQIDAHILDASVHRTIDDAGTTTVDLWSADKIGTELATKSGVSHLHTGVYEPANANLLQISDIGTSLQAYDLNLDQLAALPYALHETLFVSASGVLSTMKNNWNSAVDPSSINDFNAGYRLGSQWVNIVSNESFVLTHSTGAGDAIWKSTTGNAAFDSHAADTSIHFTQAAISINEAQIADLQSYVLNSEKGVLNGVATLDGSAKIPSAQLPALALTTINTVASEVDQIALVAQEGDVAIRTDLNKTFAHNGGVASDITDWSELLTPTDQVLSVDGLTGAVNLSSIYEPKNTNIQSHILDASVHRAILDTGTAVTDLWSADKIGTELATKALSIHTHVEADITDLDKYTVAQVDTNVGIVQTDITNHKNDATIHFTQANISITESQISDLKVYSLASHTHALNDLTDSTIASPLNDQVLTFETASGLWKNKTPVAGITDHLLLSNIGTNSHAQIDTHLADVTVHRTIDDAGITTTDLWSADKITSELLLKSDATHVHALNDLSDVNTPTPNNNDVMAFNSTSSKWEAVINSGSGLAEGDVIALILALG